MLSTSDWLTVVHVGLMSNYALVNVVRGHQHQVTTMHEGLLEEIYMFFAKIRVRPPPQARPPMQRKVLTLPNFLTDWYVPRNVGVPQRFLESNPDEQQLQRYVAKLHQLGIPTFLLEERQPHVSKFFVSLEAYVRAGKAYSHERVCKRAAEYELPPSTEREL